MNSPEIEHCLPSFLKSYKVLKRKDLTFGKVALQIENIYNI